MSSQTPGPAARGRRLVRRTDDRIFAGVASGLADYLGLDPVLVRVGFVVLAFAGGAGLIAYLALWLLTPEGIPGDEPAAPASERGAPFWVAIVLFVLAALALADAVFDRSIVWPIVLIGAGVALWQSDERRAQRTTSQNPPTTGEPGPDQETTMPVPTTTPSDTVPRWTPPPPPGAQPPSGPTPPQPLAPRSDWRPPRPEPSYLGRITLAAALISVGGGYLLDQAGVIEYTATYAFSTALLILGVGLVVGAWVGRARWLMLPATLVVLPGLILTSVAGDVGLNLSGGLGERRHVADAAVEIRDEYRLGIGQLEVDLRDLDLDGETAETRADLGIGQLVIYVPEDVTVELEARMAGGELRAFGVRENGTGIDRTIVDEGVEGAGRLRIEAGVSFGEIRVLRR